ncbi:DUF4845 domain-containing protein [Granulosicoccus sp. 3-233]|uniref:DUF4845 domain-containing protein n=1 Tax=Granulosicoccus sp. 3-233 TaxID=3417969 RepID=UPI003D3354CD
MGFTQNSNHQPTTGVYRVRRREAAPGMQHQRGMGMLSIFAIIAVTVFIGLFAIKVGPNYMENWTVSKIASDVASNPDLLRQPRSKVYSYINQAYRTNSLWDLKPEETIKLKKDGKRGYIVSVQYEKRDKLFSNIDLVTSFDKEATPVH